MHAPLPTVKASTIDKFTWPLIYGGILLLLLGISTLSADASLGWTIVTVGTLLAVIGVFTIYLRSRIGSGSVSRPKCNDG